MHGRAETLRRPGVAILAGVVAITSSAACGNSPEPDAYGNFEAVEVVVSAQTSGQVQRFSPIEGMRLDAGVKVVQIDTTQLSLERAQLTAQRATSSARAVEVSRQLEVLEVQRDIARRAYERTKRLHAQQAATTQRLDQAERDYRELVARMEALRAQRASAASEVASNEARVRQVEERIATASVENPQAGTVLVVHARVGEIVQPGQPLYTVASLDTLVLRAYVTGDQLAEIALGEQSTIRVSGGVGQPLTMAGTVVWISDVAEFTPTPVQTRDERATLVYAVKLRVPNPRGVLKIGMPADVTFGPPAVTQSATQ